MQSRVVSRIKSLLEFFHTNYGSTILVLNIDTHLKCPKYPFDFLSKGSSFSFTSHLYTKPITQKYNNNNLLKCK